LATRYPEPFGLVVAEALSTGVPVILPEASLLAPEVTARGLGLLCDMQRPETLQAAIARMRDLPAEAIRDMSLRAADPANALANTPEGWADGLIALYEGCLSGAMPSRAIPA
ncbi:glycosyltransferase, partial [Thioclava sp. BHET1]